MFQMDLTEVGVFKPEGLYVMSLVGYGRDHGCYWLVPVVMSKWVFGMVIFHTKKRAKGSQMVGG